MEPGPDDAPALRRFAELVTGAADDVPLDLTALAVAEVLRRTTDRAGALQTLDRLAETCPQPTFPALVSHLFDVQRYGAPGSMQEPHHSLLDLVLASRRGVPIVTAVVVIEVGRRLDVPVRGVGMPMHFLLVDGNDPEAVVDPVGGAVVGRRGARERFELMARGRAPWKDKYLRTVPARHIVIRMLSNLRAAYLHRGHTVPLALVDAMRAAVPELAAEQAGAARRSAAFN
ncbi:MAG: hypothetical protein H0U21_02310 [Acidimicrobiia bacterium]|nr:hypothetical protein [Acidimicrobiia bacterium]